MNPVLCTHQSFFLLQPTPKSDVNQFAKFALPYVVYIKRGTNSLTTLTLGAGSSAENGVVRMGVLAGSRVDENGVANHLSRRPLLAEKIGGTYRPWDILGYLKWGPESESEGHSSNIKFCA